MNSDYSSEDEQCEDISASESGEDSFELSSSEEECEEDTDVDWSQVRVWHVAEPNTDCAPPRFPFSANPGCTIPFAKDELAIFEHFFDRDLLEMIQMETAKYIRQCGSTSSCNVLPPSCEELQIFLAITILQSVVQKPELQMYWSRRASISTSFFNDVMSHKRFCQIKKYLHFSDNEVFDAANHPNPKLNKIWPVYQYLENKFKTSYVPERDITVDESLLLYKGRLGWVQYIPMKRARFGIKFYMLCESTSGYVWSLIIYTGKGTKLDADFADFPMSSQIVLTLVKPLLRQGYCLTTDNFYTSPQLSDFLILNSTDSYGTVKVTRKEMPQSLRNKKLRKGEIAAERRGKVLAMRWKDKKDVVLLSTIHTMDMVETEKRTKKIIKPKLVLDYNDTMGGVDRADQRMASYPIPRKQGKKYYKKIFFRLLEITVWNSFILYGKSGGKKDSLEFMLTLSEKIIEKYKGSVISPKPGRPGRKPHPLRLTERHFPEVIEPTEKKSNPTRVCTVCSKKQDARGKRVRRETRYYCPQCQVALCVTPCFRIYHTQMDF